MRALLPLLLLSACATRPAEVRVAFDAGSVTSIHASGYADRATHRRVTADDPVRVASISKMVTALGVMRLVEAGKLDLDRDVSDYLGWRVRNPAFPDAPVTLRLLLSHRSSLTDEADYAIPLGKTLHDTLANPKAWNAAHAPGSWFRYTNLNFPVVASVMESVTGERFDTLMARLVFQPLQLDACFNWTTCSDAKLARAVLLYDDKGAVLRDDLHGQRPACPVLAPDGCDLAAYRPGNNGALFSPQGGLRISARDLARIGQMVLQNDGSFLKPETVNMLEVGEPGTAFITGETENGFYCQYGLAWQSLPSFPQGCRDDLFGNGHEWRGHAGEAYGVRSGLWLSGDKGIAFFATAVPDGQKGKHSAFSAAEERLTKGK
ncbi:D-alanyl-D-alanine carboxypeptidase [Sphingomonas antarctica]|uniref:serine hydrolase domain-containing protein n=1 Tax=Sphingomonas antarctica TaxID=2040274 RepID=UPI0039E7FA41